MAIGIFAHADMDAVRVQPRCPYVGTCGGCQLQDRSYDDQARLKHQHVQRLLHEIAPDLTVEFVVADDPWRYRNKTELTFGAVDGQLVIGFHAARSFTKIVPVDDCVLLPEALAPIWRDVQQLARDSGESVHNPRSHEGFFRHVVLRQNRAGQVLLMLVTAPGSRAVIERIAQHLTLRHPHLRSFYWGTTTRLADVAIPDTLTLLYGQPDLEERIGPFRVRVNPVTFLQPNVQQAERLYATVREWLLEDRAGIAWDVYCGIGLVGMYLSEGFKRVYGIDVDPQNLELARANAAAHNLANLEFHVGPAEDVLANKRFWLLEAKPDVIVVDPPRAGLHPRVLGAMLSARPRQVAYVSCNPQALVRDVQQLARGFPRYRVTRATAFDVFPQTTHVEVVALLER